MLSLKRWGAAAALTLIVSAAAFAADATGKWTWTVTRQGNEITQVLELKQDGEKLTGNVSRQGGDQKTEIKEGKVKGNELSFDVVRERNGQEFKMHYTGTVDGDTIKGKTTFKNQNGEERSRDWMAKRQK